MIRILAATLLAVSTASAQVPNDCIDPYWASTLRCRNAIDPANLVPQPPITPPTTPGDLEDYTRVDLAADPSVRCLDGTVPVIYVAKAVGPPSRDWLITLTGGGSCHAGASLADGQDCLDAYGTSEAAEMSSAEEPAMKDLGLGINTSNLSINPVFARFHRVRIEKCSYDRYNGRSTRHVTAAHPTLGIIDYDLFQHGQRIVETAIATLRPGLEYTSWRRIGSEVQEYVESLPPLAGADRVVLLGHSGAAHGLMHTADRFREAIQAAPFGGDVRVVLDANFLHATENEAAFNDPPLPAGTSLYDHVTSGTSPAVAPLSSTYTPAWWSDPASGYRIAYASWSEDADPFADVFDGSCVAAHPTESWRCADRFHVLFNHLTTPVFVREDLSDPNLEHGADGLGHLVQWGEFGNYAHCASTWGTAPCPPLLDSASHRARTLEQRRAFAEEARVRSELVSSFATPGTGPPSDPTGGGFVPTRYFFLPDCASHAGAYALTSYFQTMLASSTETTTMRKLLEDFVSTAPAIGATTTWAEGVDGVTSACPPAVASGSVDGLLLAREAGGALRLTWSPSCVANDVDYAVYEGSLGAFLSHESRACTTGGAAELVLAPRPGGRYYLVTATSGSGEGSYGKTSFGVERGQGTRACFPQSVAACGP
jgi:hypothetical protein